MLQCVPSVLLPPSFCFNNSGAPGELFPEFCSVESKILLYVKNVSFAMCFCQYIYSASSFESGLKVRDACPTPSYLAAPRLEKTQTQAH